MSAPAPAAGFIRVPGQPVTVRDKIGFFAMVVGMFMAILDIQIVSSSIREIQAGLNASAEEITWIQTSYLIAEVIMIPFSGYLSRLFGTRLVFTVSAFSFTAASFLCALAWNLESMVVFRAIQGFLGGAMIPTVFSASFMLFPGVRRGGAVVVMGLVATAAPTLGPVIGGYVTQVASWHWLFLVNMLPGIVIGILAWMFVDLDRPDFSLLKGFDFIGLISMALFLGTAEYVLEEGPRHEWFDQPSVLYLAIVCVASAVVFFWRVLTYRNPIVDLYAFTDRNFAIGCLFSFIIGIGLYGAIYLMPVFLARVRGYDSFDIGVTMMVVGAFQFGFGPIAGRICRVVDPRYALGFGVVLFALGTYLNADLTNESSFGELFLPQALRGSALMFCFIPINMLALGTLKPDKVKNGAGLYNLMRNLGGAFGLAGLNTALISRYDLHYSQLAEQVTMARPGVRAFIDGLAARMGDVLPGDAELAAIKSLYRMAQREAYVLTMSDTFVLMSIVFMVFLLLLPLMRKMQIPPLAPPPAKPAK